MSEDRTLFINNSWGVQDIVDVLETLIQIDKVNIVSTCSPDYTVLAFNYDSSEGPKPEGRNLNIHRGSTKGGFDGTLITLGAWGSSEKILKTIAERLGGFYEHSDCDGNLVAYQYAAEGNLDFHLRFAVIQGRTDGRDIDQFAKTAKELNASFKQHEVKL